MSNNIIDKIQLSGVTYDIGGQGGSGVSVVEVTQAEYDVLPSSAKTDISKMYVITDAQAGDLTQYWTSAQTQSAITQATSGKVDTTTFNAYSGSVETALSGKQATLVSGTNIKTINNESILGSGNIDIQGGGGKAIEAGRGISITTGATADTVSFNLPISAGTGTNSIREGSLTAANGNYSHAEGFATSATSDYSHAEGFTTVASGYNSHAEGSYSEANGNYSHAEGYQSEASGYYSHAEGYKTSATSISSHAEGAYNSTSNSCEHASGRYNITTSASTTFGDSGNTLFSVGNGTSNNARHNAFEIRQNGDIYISSGGTDIKLQDALGGGGSSYTAGDGIDITSDVISVTGKVDTTTYSTYTAATYNRLDEDEEVTAAALNNLNEALSGKQDTLSAGTNITISGNVISASGGGKAIKAGRGITVTTGETADTISFSLPISDGTGMRSIIEGLETLASGDISHAEGFGTLASGEISHAEGYYTTGSGESSHAEGYYTIASGASSHAEGYSTIANGILSHAEGYSTIANNYVEHASGKFNVSTSASTTFGDSGNTLFSVGNGTADNARHNAFEIRQNGDIYFEYDGADTKLQDKFDEVEQVTARALIDLNDALSGKVNNSAITTTITSASTDSEIPSAKAVYDVLGDVETLLSQI